MANIQMKKTTKTICNQEYTIQDQFGANGQSLNKHLKWIAVKEAFPVTDGTTH